MSEQTFLLPDLGEGLTEAEILRWLIAEGDTVALDQAVVEVETAKSAVEVPAPFSGSVTTLHGAEGDKVAVGSPLISIATAVEATPNRPEDLDTLAADGRRGEETSGSGNVLIGYGTSTPARSGRRRQPRPAMHPESPTPHQTSSQPTTPRVMSPLVRQLARTNGVRLDTVTGTGNDGVITRGDVERATRNAALPAATQPANAAPAPTPTQARSPGEHRRPLDSFRQAVSATLSRSRAEIPEATVWVDVDATELVALREQARTTDDPGPGLLAYLARFVVAGLREYPILNARLDTERQEIIEYEQINLGIAVHSERGLLVPAVVGAETMTTFLLNREIHRLTSAARTGHVSPKLLSAGTFTLNNYGSFRVDGSAAIINHPQVAILGFGRVLERPWIINGHVSSRKITQMSLVFDHRVCDGGTAAGFMRSIADAIENPTSAIPKL